MQTQSSHSVSIITPVYNHEKFIGACIESVLSQGYQDWELLIIDDGSTDATAEVIRRYSDPRIRYFHQENQGIEALAHTYNRALSLSHGRLVGILEGDDTWPPEKLSTLAPLFADPNIVLAYGEVQDIDAEGHPASRVSRVARKQASLPRPILFNDPIRSATSYLLTMEGQSLIAPSTVLIRRSTLDAIGGFQYVPGICLTDAPTFVRLSMKGKFHYVPSVMGHRRRHLYSATLVFLDAVSTVPGKFMLQLAESPDLGISEAERSLIRKSWSGKTNMHEFTAGRLCLLRQEWKQARSHFCRAFDVSKPRTSIGAGAGWLFSWFHRDIEYLFQLAGRAPLRASE